MSTLRSAAHLRRAAIGAGSGTLCAGLGMHLADSATAGTAEDP